MEKSGAAMETRRRNVMFSGRSIVGLVALFLVSGCVSLSARNPTRPLVASSEMSKDQNDCERYANGQTKDKGEYYRACMISRSYATNVEMDDLDWTLGIAQTRPHEPSQVMKDMEECDERADDTKKRKSDAPPLTPEQERIIASQGVNLQRRPDAARVLVRCLDERGYQVVPRVTY
jgi:hypothetical protein